MSVYLILELSERDQWPGLHGTAPHALREGPRLIPTERRPAVLQHDRATAERECLRLTATRPGRKFVIFEAVAMGLETKIPTHTNIRGDVLFSRMQPLLVDLNPNDDVPF